MRFAFVLLVPRLRLYDCFACDRVFGCRCVLQGCVSYYTRVDCMCVFWCVVGSFVCAFMFVFRVFAYEFACVCCNVVFYITRVCILHVCYVFVCCLFVCLCLYARFACDCVAYAVVCCKVACHITRVCRLHVCFAFVF